MDREILQNAAGDAKHIVEACSVVRAMVACDIIARRVLLLARQSIHEEIHQGWDVAAPELVT